MKKRDSSSGEVIPTRQSGIELLRIIMMLVIIAHHYVVNSGLLEVISNDVMSPRSILLLIFGWGGKFGINCFVMITGYFMCKSEITLKKFLKLLLEIESYKIGIYIIFVITGYAEFSMKALLKAVLPIYSIGTGFAVTYLVFFLFIPFLNILLKGMDERQHIWLMLLCFVVFTIFPSFFMADVKVGYIGWFMVIYIIAAYIRLYPKKWFGDNRIWGVSTICLWILSWFSVVCCVWLSNKMGKQLYYYFVNDSNKILALITAVSTFMFFKNLKIGYSKLINSIAASAFGVLLIHANSDIMRQWLWKDILNNVGMYYSQYLMLHAVLSVLGIYIICTLIDMIRIRLFEIPVMKLIDNLIESRKQKAV